MAIVNSLAVGKATKTAGEITYANVRGRTIARRRIIANKSDTAEQRRQRTQFGKVSTLAAIIDPYIKQNFVPSAYGSARNRFIKSCWAQIRALAANYNYDELTYEQILQLFPEYNIPAQLGIEISGGISLTSNEDDTSLKGHLSIADMGYTKVEFQVMNITTKTYIASVPATLENGIWSADLSIQWSSSSKVVMFLAYVDGKPINNYSAYKANPLL